MKRIISILITTITLLTFSSCTKSIEDTELGYVGIWSSNFASLTINSDGSGTYNDYAIGTTSITDGKVRIKNDKLRIRASFPVHFITKKFDIDTPPKYDTDGNIFMVLDSEIFYKYEDYYY